MANNEMTHSEKIIEMQFTLADVAIDKGDYDAAFKVYKTIAELAGSPRAKYQLGVLSALGKGTQQSYLQAAQYFLQVNDLLKDKDSHNMFLRSTLDFFKEDILEITSSRLWEKALTFAQHVFPNENKSEISIEYLTKLLDFYSGKNEYTLCLKILQAMSVYGNHSESQNLLGVFYNQGVGTTAQNDLIALYWFDRAAKQGNQEAKSDAIGIFNGYKKSLAKLEFIEYMNLLSDWCSTGTADIPRNLENAKFWKSIKVNSELYENKEKKFEILKWRKCK